jgi:hypothetical protein
MAMKDAVNIPVIVTISIIGSLMVMVLVVGVQAWFLWEVNREVAVKWENTKQEPYTSLRKAQLEEISSYRWVEPDAKMVAMPVQAGMERLIASGGKMPTSKPSTQPTR